MSPRVDVGTRVLCKYLQMQGSTCVYFFLCMNDTITESQNGLGWVGLRWVALGCIGLGWVGLG